MSNTGSSFTMPAHGLFSPNGTNSSGLARSASAAADASLTYGTVPPGLFVTIRERFFAGRQFLNARRVPRT
jgi:hypothetical protein